MAGATDSFRKGPHREENRIDRGGGGRSSVLEFRSQRPGVGSLAPLRAAPLADPRRRRCTLREPVLGRNLGRRLLLFRLLERLRPGSAGRQALIARKGGYLPSNTEKPPSPHRGLFL